MSFPSARVLWRALAGEGSAPSWLAPLHQHNQALWHLEARVRSRALADSQVADLKRQIDALNLARHGAVAAIDAAVDAHFRPTATLETPGVVLSSESVGQLLDRLSILALKQAAWAGTPRAAGVEARVELLVRCLDRSLVALAEGRTLPQSFDEAKTYGA